MCEWRTAKQEREAAGRGLRRFLIAWLTAFLLCCAGLYIAAGCAIDKLSAVTIEQPTASPIAFEPALDAPADVSPAGAPPKLPDADAPSWGQVAAPVAGALVAILGVWLEKKRRARKAARVCQ